MAAGGMVRVDLSVQVKAGGVSYGPGKGILVPAGVAKMFAKKSVSERTRDSRAASARNVPPAARTEARAKGTHTGRPRRGKS